jgi:acyl-CoA synthetase (AMP-forming)/AMP-acid ligase II
MKFVHDLIDRAARRAPCAEAVADTRETLSYLDLWDRSVRFARWLFTVGVRAGDRVLFRGRDSCWTAAALFGASRVGAAFTPVSVGMTSYQFHKVLRDASPTVVILEDTSAVDWVRKMSSAVVVAADDLPMVVSSGDALLPTGTDSRTPALLIYTSGSTADPKAIVCPHQQVLFAAEAIAVRLEYRPDDVIFVCVPLSFDYGLYQLLLATIATAKVVIADPSPADLLARVRLSRATVVPMVPSLCRILLSLARRDSRPVEVRLFTNTGESLSRRATHDLRLAFPAAKIVLMYGISECKRVSISDPDDDLLYPGTVGRPLPGTSVEITGEDGLPVESGRTGEIVVKGPHLMAGYWRAPDITKRVFRRDSDFDVALYTGDFGRMDAVGNLYFEGRRDGIFKRRGFRVSTAEIEAAAMEVAGVEAAAAVVPKPEGELALYVVGAVVGADVLMELARRLEAPKIPDRCYVVTQIPLTDTGKVNRRALGEPGGKR